MNKTELNRAIATQVKTLIADNGGVARYQANKQAFKSKLHELGAQYVACYNDTILIDDLTIQVD